MGFVGLAPLHFLLANAMSSAPYLSMTSCDADWMSCEMQSNPDGSA
jgi:hypothetical protein